VLLWREFLAIFAKRPHRAIRSGSDFPMHTSHLTRRGLVLALVGALLGLGLIHDGALAAGHSALEFGRAGALAAFAVCDGRAAAI
jgi:hypothetical protein